MAKVTQAAKVGAFVILCVVAAFAVAKFMRHGLSSVGGYHVHALLHDATGLANHSRVSIAGIAVGSIDAISLEAGQARVDLRMNPDIELFANATVGKQSTTLLGEFALVLTPGTPDHNRLKDGDTIEIVLEQSSTADIMNDVAKIAGHLKSVSEQLAKSFGTDEGGKSMAAILENVAAATSELNAMVRENRQLIHHTIGSVEAIAASSEPRIAQILENIRAVTSEVRVMMGRTAGDGGPAQDRMGELRETVANLNTASKSLSSALAHVDSVAGRADRGEGTLGRLSKDEALINEVEGVAEGVNNYVQRVTELQTIVGLRSDYNFLANTIKSYIEIRLQPREDKYYLIELINDPRGKTTFTQTDVDTTNPMFPPHYRTITTSTTDAFRFSLQFAKRLGVFTGRFGLKESTGGVGLDIHLLANRFEITQDLFGFGEETRPRYRLYLGYEFVHHLWMLGGVDNIFLSNRRDYFLGLQLRFNDSDLKTILPFSGSLSASK